MKLIIELKKLLDKTTMELDSAISILIKFIYLGRFIYFIVNANKCLCLVSILVNS